MSIAVPFVGFMALAAISLLLAPRTHVEAMIIGHGWLECLLCIPLTAIIPFGIIVLAVRQATPTNLTRAGALAGLAAVA
jgi:hypothetical protein